jgi:L-lactate utilization protein LutB
VCSQIKQQRRKKYKYSSNAQIRKQEIKSKQKEKRKKSNRNLTEFLRRFSAELQKPGGRSRYTEHRREKEIERLL